jgi:hypothetical protein
MSNPDIRHVSYPLALTVQYERNEVDGLDCDSGQPHGFAVIRLGRFEVRREPVKGSLDDARDDLERAAAEWLARITGEAAAG